MIDILIAFLVSVLLLAVFTPPAWLLKLASFGSLAFVIYALILLARYVVGKLKP